MCLATSNNGLSVMFDAAMLGCLETVVCGSCSDAADAILQGVLLPV